MNKIRNLVKKVRNIGILSNFFMQSTFASENKLTNLILDFHVRWNTAYLMLLRLEKFNKLVNYITCKPVKN